MSIQIKADQISTSGVISVNASDSGVWYMGSYTTDRDFIAWIKARELLIKSKIAAQQEQERIRKNTKTYDWMPYAKVKTDHETFMSIQASWDDQNRNKGGLKTYTYDEKIFFQWRAVFERLLPIQHGQIRVWTNPNNNTEIPWPQQETKNND